MRAHLRSLFRFAVAVLFTTSTSSVFADGADPSPMDHDGLLALLRAQPKDTALDQIPAVLPDQLLGNFVLKHGIKRKGPRGHLVEVKVSQSADPAAPRVILWDQGSGLSLSYNGGADGQSAGQRLDMLTFDPHENRYALTAIDFPLGPGGPQPASPGCTTCHGPRSRPIFSMYPDWPAFYGSDNDELSATTRAQRSEFADFESFRAKAATTHPRYRPLFSPARVHARLQRPLYGTYPFRPDTRAEAQAVSRAFAFRPGLRLGVLYNRMHAQHLVTHLRQQSRYEVFAPYFLFNLLQCHWKASHKQEAMAWAARVGKRIGAKATTFPDGGLDYRQLWALFGLKIDDVDIRYSYGHAAYANQDATHKPMEVGYIGRYFNSYFDGSATIDELVAAGLYDELAGRDKRLRGVATPRGLVEKYRHLAARFSFDEAFFRKMDARARWIAIPYPATLAAVHHRERFKEPQRAQHEALCSTLESSLVVPAALAAAEHAP